MLRPLSRTQRPIRLNVESLESRTVLSSSSLIAAGDLAVMAQSHGHPRSPVVVKLTTDHTVYQQGQPVVMTLTETNTTNHPVRVGLGPSVDGFYVTQNGRELWLSNPGPQPLFILLKTIPPHQSITLKATWNGQSNVGPPSSPTGVLVVHSQVAGANSQFIRIVPKATVQRG